MDDEFARDASLRFEERVKEARITCEAAMDDAQLEFNEAIAEAKAEFHEEVEEAKSDLRDELEEARTPYVPYVPDPGMVKMTQYITAAIVAVCLTITLVYAFSKFPEKSKPPAEKPQ